MESNYLQPLIKYDQNLIVTLYVLLREKHISNAAKHLCISQSAVSQKLAKLRYIFNDNLLVRINNEMVLTPLALKLYPMFEKHISNAIDIFDLRSRGNDLIKKVYRICVIDGFCMDLVSNKILEIIREVDFSVSFEIVNRYESCVEDLNNGNLDILIGSFEGLSNNVYQLNLGEVEYGIFCDKENNILKKGNGNISLFDIYDKKFVGFKFHGKLGCGVENVFSNSGKNINTVLYYSQYSLVAESLIGTDFLAFLPVGLVNTNNLSRLDVDVCLPKGKCYIYWHSIMENDYLHKY
ncbi:LysR family transcriptional regulator, partial [Vibrio parahaemolyticus]